MQQRPLGRTGADVSVVGLGTWQLGADWGEVDDDAAGEIVDTALDLEVTLLDTADVYGDGRSEERIRKALAPRADRPLGNVAAADLPPLTDARSADLERMYDERIRVHVHDRWWTSC